VVAQASLAQPDKPAVTAPKQIVTINALGENKPSGSGTAMDALAKKNNVKLGTLYLQPLHARTFDVYLHFVDALDKNGNPTNDSRRISSNTDSLVSGIETTLNLIWQAQANVTFSVFPPTGNEAQTIDYDNNPRDGKLTELADTDTTLIDSSDGETDCPNPGTETREIMDKLVPNYINNCNPPDDVIAGTHIPTIHIVFVRTIGKVPQSKEPGITLAYTAGRGTRFIFIQDDLQGESMQQVLAHEVGHALGMSHNAGGCTKANQSVAGINEITFTCTSTAGNPDITVTADPSIDSDFIARGLLNTTIAPNSLMWYDESTAGSHIGWPLVDQMNKLALSRNQ
jgi:Met-zincin